jgi:hypothetical protein
MTLFEKLSFQQRCCQKCHWRHDTKPNDTQHNNVQHNDTLHNDTQHNDTA